MQSAAPPVALFNIERDIPPISALQAHSVLSGECSATQDQY